MSDTSSSTAVTDTLGQVAERLARSRPSLDNLAPLSARRRMCELLATMGGEVCPASIILLFGSCARGEPAEDIDLLVIVPSDTNARTYRRVDAHGLQVDLNVASRGWLAGAHLDVEWGHCLAEAFPAYIGAPVLEDEWRRSVVRFSASAARRRRIAEHCGWCDRLAGAARERSTDDLLSRLLLFEALRLAGCALIEAFATRVFSHRTFISELRLAGRRAALSDDIMFRWVRGLTQSPVGASSAAYVASRRELSRVLRSDCGAAIGYDPAASRDLRLESLVIAARTRPCSTLAILRAADGDTWLPQREALDDAHAGAAVALAGAIAPGRRVVKPPVVEAEVPTHGAVPGARWVEQRGDDVKVILSTGGCRTPTCVFCQLPAIGRSRPKVSPSETVRAIIERTGTRALSLYNDGSLLNPAEVSPTELDEICGHVRRGRVRALRIESNPRFVTRERLTRVVALTEVADLTVAMGLQSIGNWPAVTLLGRPDMDAAFDRAVEHIHQSGARARIYLLWDHPAVSLECWVSLLGDSVAWAESRGVALVTVCPYVPSAALPESSEGSLCALRTTLSRLAPFGLSLDCVLRARVSCGRGRRCLGCLECERVLRAGTWDALGACDRWARSPKAIHRHATRANVLGC